MIDPRVSVIIPAFNAESTLRDALASVCANEGVAFEVLLVNDASTDSTEAIARAFPCRVISLRKNIMSANCRNLGAELARGSILVYFDADQVMPPGTLAAFTQELDAHPEVAAVVGSLAPDTPMPGFFSRFKNYQHHYTHQTAATEGATLASGLTAIRRREFLALGGFEPAFSGASIEDIALGYRMRKAGLRIRFAPHIQMVHLKSYTFRSMVRSDLLHRAIPWTGLMLRERIFRSDLNTRGGNVASVCLAWLTVFSLLLGAVAVLMGSPWATFAIAGSAAGFLAIAALNLDFLRRGFQQFGAAFAARAAAVLPVMYFYHGLGLLAGILTYLRGRSVAAGRERPVPDYDLIEPQERPSTATPLPHR